MSLISIIHPSRGRPLKSVSTIRKWIDLAETQIYSIISLDSNDPELGDYKTLYRNFTNNKPRPFILVSENRSCVDAINNAAKLPSQGILVVVSDDTDCFPGWDTALLKELEGKSDYLLKTDDTIQNYIVTMTVCDTVYFQRDGHIYHPDFFHQFADTYQTCKADIRGRLLFSKLKFPHLHPSYSGGKEMVDALNHRNDLSWKDGQDTFVKLMKEFTVEERNRIKDKSMRNFLKKFGL